MGPRNFLAHYGPEAFNYSGLVMTQEVVVTVVYWPLIGKHGCYFRLGV